MNAAIVSVTSADPEELACELAIATIGLDAPPVEVRVNGVRLTPLTTEADWPSAPRAWSLVDDPRHWSMVVYADEEWQVLDVFRCVDLAELVDAPITAREMLVTPLVRGWVVTVSDPEGDRELLLHVGAGQAAIWRTREAARAAAHRYAEALTAQAASA